MLTSTPCFLITLQALTETRYIDILEAPNRGRLPTFPSEVLNNIWSINSTPPNSFASDTQIFPIEGTQKVSTCPNCNGVGEIVGYVGHVAVVVAEFAQVVQEAGILSGKSMLVLEEQLSEGKFAHLAGEGAEKFAQVVAG